MAVRITCVKKDNGFHENPFTAMSDFGWINEETGKKGISTRMQIYDYLKEGGKAYVISADGQRIYLEISETLKGTKFVTLSGNILPNDNILLNLEPCR